jgi:hypothetical protein
MLLFCGGGVALTLRSFWSANVAISLFGFGQNHLPHFPLSLSLSPSSFHSHIPKCVRSTAICSQSLPCSLGYKQQSYSYFRRSNTSFPLLFNLKSRFSVRNFISSHAFRSISLPTTFGRSPSSSAFFYLVTSCHLPTLKSHCSTRIRRHLTLILNFGVCLRREKKANPRRLLWHFGQPTIHASLRSQNTLIPSWSLFALRPLPPLQPQSFFESCACHALFSTSGRSF